MKKKEKIIIKFFDCHEQENKIAKDLKIDPSYITRVIKKDKRYWQEKADRQDITKQNIKEYKRKWAYEKRHSKLEEYYAMQREHDIAGLILSNMYKSEMSNEVFVKCNRSAYEYDKNSSNLILKRNINAGYIAPKRIGKVVRASSIKNKPVYV